MPMNARAFYGLGPGSWRQLCSRHHPLAALAVFMADAALGRHGVAGSNEETGPRHTCVEASLVAAAYCLSQPLRRLANLCLDVKQRTRVLGMHGSVG